MDSLSMEVSTVFGKETHFKGFLSFANSLKIVGHFNGSIEIGWNTRY